jgi:hypothetical protein
LAGYGITDAITPGSLNLVSKYSITGTVSPATTPPRWYPDRNITITSVYFSLGTPNTTGSTIIDVSVNGTSIFSGSLPTCSTNQYKSTVITTSTAVTTSDYVTVTVNQSGGSDATVCIVYS